MGRIIPYIMETKSHVPNHQPSEAFLHDGMTVISPFLDLRSGRVGSRRRRLAAKCGAELVACPQCYVRIIG